MRKIEKEMLMAISHNRHFKKGNTAVYPQDNVVEVWLFNNHIADINQDGTVRVNIYTLKSWPTATTKSRLRALGVNIYTKNNIIYLNNKPIEGD